MKASISRFLTALEFLTRIHFTHRTEWEAGEFGRSVVFFPVAGCIIGLLMQLTFLLLLKLELPLLLQAVLLVLAEIFLPAACCTMVSWILVTEYLVPAAGRECWKS